MGYLSEQLGVTLPARWRQATPAPEPEPQDVPPTPGGDADALATLYTAAAAITRSQDDLARQMQALCDALTAAVKLLNQLARKDYRQSVALSKSEAVILDRQDFKHVYLLLPTAQAVTVDIPGLGSITRNLNADWNRLDYPNGTRVTVAADPAAGTQNNALLLITDNLINV